MTVSYDISKTTNGINEDSAIFWGWDFGDENPYLVGTIYGTPVYTYYDKDGNVLDGRPVHAGSYKLSVHADGTENYDEFTSGEINFEVKGLLFDKSSISFNDFTVEKGSNPNDIKISGELPKGVTVTYEGLPSDLKPGKFTVKAIIHLDPSIYDVDSDNEYIELTATVTVTGASDGGFPVVPVAVGGVAAVAVIAVIIAVVLKKKRP